MIQRQIKQNTIINVKEQQWGFPLNSTGHICPRYCVKVTGYYLISWRSYNQKVIVITLDHRTIQTIPTLFI